MFNPKSSKISHKKDALHKKGTTLQKELIRLDFQFITTDFVTTELLNYFSVVDLKPFAIKIVDLIKSAHDWEVVSIDQGMLDRGYDLYKKMTDKDWSLTDCISIVLARERKITQVFTHDHHFEQAGFEILLKL